DVVAARDRGLAGTAQRLAPAGEELPRRPLRRRHPQPEVTAMTRLVERVDRRLDAYPVTTRDLAGISLLQESEVAVDHAHLPPPRGGAPLASPRKVQAARGGRRPPRRHAVMLADLDHRLGQPVQRRRRQARRVPGPLILRQGVQEEGLLIAVADLRGLAPLQGHYIE